MLVSILIDILLLTWGELWECVKEYKVEKDGITIRTLDRSHWFWRVKYDWRGRRKDRRLLEYRTAPW